MATQAVLRFLGSHNRPFSVNEIHQGVKDDFGKAAVQKALDELVEEEKVKEKIYGKQKVYCIIQQNKTEAQLKEKLLVLDNEIKEVELQLKDVSEEFKKTVADLAEMEGKISLTEALNKKLELEKELEEVKKGLEKHSNTETICPKVKRAADEEYEKAMNEYKKRKRICTDVLSAILENFPHTKQMLFDEIGIENDESAGFSVDKL